MVENAPSHPDAVFRAVADHIRRPMIGNLSAAVLAITDVDAPLHMTFAALAKPVTMPATPTHFSLAGAS